MIDHSKSTEKSTDVNVNRLKFSKHIFFVHFENDTFLIYTPFLFFPVPEVLLSEVDALIFSIILSI